MARDIKKQQNPLVTVIIPTYNRQKLLSRAIKSVLNQTYHNFEIIVIDDGSKDNTKNSMTNFSDPRIEYIRKEKNRGKAIVVNEAIKLSKGKFITILDDDDELVPSMLEMEMKYLKNTSDNIGYACGLRLFIQDNKGYLLYKNIHDKTESIFKCQLLGGVVSISGAVFKKSCINKIGFFQENLFYGIDWEFMLRFMKKFQGIYINKPLYLAYYNRRSGSQNISKRSKKNYLNHLHTYKFMLLTYYDEIKKYKDILAEYYYSIGRLLQSINKLKLSGNFYKKALIIYPLNPKYYLYFFISKFFNKIPSIIILLNRIYQLQASDFSRFQ